MSVTSGNRFQETKPKPDCVDTRRDIKKKKIGFHFPRCLTVERIKNVKTFLSAAANGRSSSQCAAAGIL